MTTALKTNGPRAEFLAQNAQAARLQKSQLAEIIKRIGKFFEVFKPAMMGVVASAENARQAGVMLCEFEETLPGRKLTLDFYEQLRAEFVDRRGHAISFDQLQWFMRVARQHPDPFTEILDALQYKQPMLLASGEFNLESQRPPQTSHSPPEPAERLKAYFDSGLADTIRALRENPDYCPGGRLRPDLREVLMEDLAPKLKVWDEGREWLRSEMGI